MSTCNSPEVASSRQMKRTVVFTVPEIRAFFLLSTGEMEKEMVTLVIHPEDTEETGNAILAEWMKDETLPKNDLENDEIETKLCNYKPILS